MRALVCVLLLAGCASAPVHERHAALVFDDPLLLRDAFVAPSDAPEYGLSSALSVRQRGALAPAPWSRRSGVWFEAPPADPEVVRVGGDATPGLYFHGFGGARLDAPLALDELDRIEASIDPVLSDTASMGWVALSLTSSRESGGWPTGPEMVLGFLVRSNGAIQVFSNGDERAPVWTAGPPAPSAVHAVALALEPVPENDPPSWRVRGTVDGAEFTSELPGTSDPRALVYLHVTAHFHPGDAELSRLADLAVYRRISLDIAPSHP